MYSKPLPQLETTGLEAVEYWERGPWFEARNRTAIVETDDPILVLFCEDKNGKILPKSEIKAARNAVKAYFEFLWTKKIAPSCWGDAPLNLRTDFVRKMEEEYEWLRYCNRHWKAEQLFMNYYPQWYKSKTKPRKRKEHPEDAIVVDDDNNNENPSGSKRPRVEEPEPTPPPARPAPTAVTTTRRVRLL